MEGVAFQTLARACAFPVTPEILAKCCRASPQNVLTVVPASQTPLRDLDIHVDAGPDIVETTANTSLFAKPLSLAPTVERVPIFWSALIVIVLISGRVKTVPFLHVISASAVGSSGHVL